CADQGAPAMDDPSHVEEGPLQGRPSPDGSGSDRRTVAGRPDGAVPGAPGATVASPGFDRPAPDAGPRDPVAGAAPEPTFGPPPDPRAATGDGGARPAGIHDGGARSPGYEMPG